MTQTRESQPYFCNTLNREVYPLEGAEFAEGDEAMLTDGEAFCIGVWHGGSWGHVSVPNHSVDIVPTHYNRYTKQGSIAGA